MSTANYTLTTERANNQGQPTIKTTLYDLIETISEEVNPGEDRMVVETVLHMLNSGRIRFTGQLKDFFVLNGVGKIR